MARPARRADALQLGLFDALSTGAPAAPPLAPPMPRGIPPGPPAAQPSAADGAPSVLRHPRAQRELQLGEHRLAYELRRSRRRSIGFVVGAEGLSVAAPRWVGIGDIEAALREKSAWILRKLAEQREHGQRLLAARVDWRDGVAIPFLGQPVNVVLDPRAGNAPSGAVLDADAAPGAAHRRLVVGLPQGATPEQIRDVVQSWLQRQARRIFEERCRHFAALLNVRLRRLSLSSARTRWGSANADGSVRLNWRLVHFGMATIDYVVAHELAHLRHMDHGPQFWDLVRSVVPDIDGARGTLRSKVLPGLE
jgi:predicted metal-dependent hydrolase